MQIALTKKLATAMGVKPAVGDASPNPLFCWTANWTNTFKDGEEDLIVMVNHATRFTVTIYGIRRDQMKDIGAMLYSAIKNTLLAIYKATRRLIVPADITFSRLHEVLQEAFNWENYHLYDFAVFNKRKVCARLVPDEEMLEYAEDAALADEHTLSEYFPEQKRILYTYDMGDSWEHVIELLQIIDDYGEESPYLLEASGQSPPEDVGGVGGFIDFYEIMRNPQHPEYARTKEWAGFWSPELEKWRARPRLL